jgi:hypothetical protein
MVILRSTPEQEKGLEAEIPEEVMQLARDAMPPVSDWLAFDEPVLIQRIARAIMAERNRCLEGSGVARQRLVRQRPRQRLQPSVPAYS